MSIQVNRVEVSGGGEDGDVESGEEVRAVGGVVGDGDPMIEGVGDDERCEVRGGSVEVEKTLLRWNLWSVRRRRG